MSKIFKSFATSKALEKDGVWLVYEDVKFLVARAGGANTAFAELLTAKLKPLRFQIERGTLPKEEDERISAEIYAATVIKDVQVLVNGKWQPGVPTDSDEVLPVTKEAVVKLMLALPDMFRDLKQAAADSSKFLKSEEEADLKNSKQS